ncbi:MAG: class I SAM-dependent methyltransferase, partial [Verrucomicrobiota bacterium]
MPPSTLSERHLTPEKLDELLPEDPRAQRSRLDLRLINWLMGNHRILGRYAAAFSWKSAVELGAGDGELLRRLASRFPDRHLRGIDFA